MIYSIVSPGWTNRLTALLLTLKAEELRNWTEALLDLQLSSELSLSADIVALLVLVSLLAIVASEEVIKLIWVINDPAVILPNSHERVVVPSGFLMPSGSQLTGCIYVTLGHWDEPGIYVKSAGIISVILTLTATPGGLILSASDVGCKYQVESVPTNWESDFVLVFLIVFSTLTRVPAIITLSPAPPAPVLASYEGTVCHEEGSVAVPIHPPFGSNQLP